jgi:integrase
VANRKVILLWYCRTPKGWRRFPVVYGKNNRLKHGYVSLDGQQVHFPDGRYELRLYEGSKAVYKRAGENAADAVAARDREESLLVVKDEAVTAKVKVIEEPGRVYLKRAANDFVRDAEQRQALEAAEINRNVTDEFIAVSKLTFADEVTREHVFRFHKHLRERGCGDRTVANKHARLKAFFRFAKMDYEAILPPSPKYDATLPTTYTADETKAILSAADPYMRLVLELGLKCGLRERELMHLEWSDIHWDDSVLRVTSKPQWDFKIKDSEQRDIPIPKDLMSRLKIWHKAHPKSRLIFGTISGLPNGKLLRTLKRLAKRSGLNCGACEGCQSLLGECQQWTLHKLRRTFCTTLLRNGLDLSTVQKFMGHADLASTMRYLRPATGKESQAKINAIVWT